MVRKLYRRILLLPVFLLAVVVMPLTMQACSEATQPEYFSQTFKIWVDSLTVTPSLAVGDTLEATFFGYVGPNDCHSFAGFSEKIFEHRLELTLWTRYFRSVNEGCVWGTVYLLGEPYRYSPSTPGPLELVIHQPGGSTLTRTIQVEASPGP